MTLVSLDCGLSEADCNYFFSYCNFLEGYCSFYNVHCDISIFVIKLNQKREQHPSCSPFSNKNQSNIQLHIIRCFTVKYRSIKVICHLTRQHPCGHTAAYIDRCTPHINKWFYRNQQTCQCNW